MKIWGAILPCCAGQRWIPVWPYTNSTAGYGRVLLRYVSVCVCHIFNILIYLEIWVCSNRKFNYVSVFWWSGLEGILCHIHRIIITIITTSFIDQTADGHTGCSLTGLQKSMCVQTFVNCLNFIHAKYPTVAPQKWDISHLVSRRGGGGGLKARWQKRTNKRRAPCLRETLAETDVFLFAGTSRF